MVRILGLVLLRLVGVVCLGDSWPRGRGVCRVYWRAGWTPGTRGPSCLLALHLELLGFPLALFGGLKLLVLRHCKHLAGLWHMQGPLTRAIIS